MKLSYLGFMFLVLLSACTPTSTPTPTYTETLIPSPSSTITPSIPPTWTHPPTLTPTLTLTPTRTVVPTSTETQAPIVPAELFIFKDGDGQVIDWSYAHISSITRNEHGMVTTLSGFLAFQLLDRAIHRDTITFDGQTLTIYYLNTQHEFNGRLVQVKLILSATSGTDIPLGLIPAGGNAFVKLRILPNWEIFDAYSFHRDANTAYADRTRHYPDVMLTNLEKLLPTLPAELIVLADAQILFDPDTYGYIVKFNIDNVPYLAGRAMPFLTLDAYNRVTGPSPEATNLENLLVNLTPLPDGIPFFSSDILVMILNSAQIPNLP
jgi:hypothetical protein